MKTRELGRSGLQVSALGLGCMGISQSYGTPLSKEDGVKLIRDAIDRNLAFVDLLKQVASEKGATPAQVALAWLLTQRPYIVPIPGTTKLHRLEENIGAASLRLSADDLSEINEGASRIQPEGDRYAPAQMAMVGREAPAKADA